MPEGGSEHLMSLRIRGCKCQSEAAGKDLSVVRGEWWCGITPPKVVIQWHSASL